MPRIWRIVSKLRYMPGFYWIWQRSFPGSAAHWQQHYERGGDSGPGSYREFAEYKARLINKTIRKYNIRSIIELGCGDGNQLSYIDVDEYIGLDISKVAIARCRKLYVGNMKRSFIWYDPDYFHDPLHIVSADCAMSLDVIFHLIEDDIFARYIKSLFNCGRRLVMIYAFDREKGNHDHVSVRYRKYSDYIAGNIPEFRVLLHVPATEAFGDFYLYERINS
jgi:hypothetical protein